VYRVTAVGDDVEVSVGQCVAVGLIPTRKYSGAVDEIARVKLCPSWPFAAEELVEGLVEELRGRSPALVSDAYAANTEMGCSSSPRLAPVQPVSSR
jgi:hypothetical protein